MSPEQFRHWRRLMGWTQPQAAAALGVSPRTVFSCEQSSVPEPIARACVLLLNENMTSAALQAMLIEQHDDLAKARFLVVNCIIEGDVAGVALFPPRIRDEVAAWMQDETPSARVSVRTLLILERRRIGVPVVLFENDRELVLFKLRWL